jgi:RNA polymerase sigma factor (sigma-70 family)
LSLQLLIESCLNSNTKAQEELYQLFAGKFFGICLKYSRNYAEAQDNHQDGFVLIFEKMHQFKFNGSFEGWAKRIMINNILKQYKKLPFLELVADIADEEHLDLEDENIDLNYLLKIIQELPDRYRLIFNLYVMDGYNHHEISEMLKISDGTSKSNLFRAKLLLKEKIETYKKQLKFSQKNE